MTLEELRSHREELLAICKKHGAYNVRVFGSVVRGEAGPDSDIDLLVDMEKGRSLLDLVGSWQDIEEDLGFKVDIVTARSISRHFREQVLSEAKVL
jgi:hypothetical protein